MVFINPANPQQKYNPSIKKKLIIDVIDPINPTFGSDDRGNTSVVINTNYGVQEVVERIVQLAKIEQGLIYQLAFIGHGMSGAQMVGVGTGRGLTPPERKHAQNQQMLSHKNLPRLTATLSKLTPLFHPQGKVLLEGCNVGEGKGGTLLLQGLSKIWKVPVEGSTRLQTQLIKGFEGEVKKCTPIKCTKTSSFLGALWRI